MARVMEGFRRPCCLSSRVEQLRVDICQNTFAGRREETSSSLWTRRRSSETPRLQMGSNSMLSSFISDSFTTPLYRISCLKSSFPTASMTTSVSCMLILKSWSQRTLLLYCLEENAAVEAQTANKHSAKNKRSCKRSLRKSKTQIWRQDRQAPNQQRLT
jgi:hypothetical protein